ncbi:MAG: hypothetical protein ABI852_18910 [Gemmatimonadaceae bacterium]
MRGLQTTGEAVVPPDCVVSSVRGAAEQPEIRMRRTMAQIHKVLTVWFVFVAFTHPAFAQPTNPVANIPVVSIPAASSISTQKFGGIIGIRELHGGRVLVDDGGSRQLRLFDSTLTFGMIVLDSVSEGSNMYGRRRAPIIPYLADSTLFPDYAAFAMLVIDGKGQVIRSMALPTQSDIGIIRQGAGLDKQGRLVFVGQSPTITPSVAGSPQSKSDSMPLLRADFDLRRTDTIGQVLRPMRVTRASSPDGSATLGMWTVDGLRTLDDWAILSDGTIALVRGHDYHVDWIRANDLRDASEKLPFDWKRLTDDDKQRMIDSARQVLSESMADGSIVNRVELMTVTRVPGTRPALQPATPRPAPARGSTAFPGFTLLPSDAVQLGSVHDYYPPLRSGAAMADADGNLWILPSTSKQSQQGELVYDVLNTKGELFRRVRVPLGRLIVGFGIGGVVYMSSGSIANGFLLERSRVALAAVLK